MKNRLGMICLLYIEDDRISAMIMQKFFEKVDSSGVAEAQHTDVSARLITRNAFRVDLAPDPFTALEKLQSYKYDLVLMDINLGDDELDGVELLHRLRKMEDYQHTPVFAVTSYAMPEDRSRFLELGFDRYFSKPVEQHAIVRAVCEELEL